MKTMEERLINQIHLLEQKNSELAAENNLLKAQIKAQSDRSDFVEDCIAEMATQVYGGV
jgi:cell division protein FtsB